MWYERWKNIGAKPISVDVDFWTNNIMQSNPIAVNVPFVEIPSNAGISITRPAFINAIFTLAIGSFMFQDIPVNNIGPVFSLELWGYDSQNQAILIGQKYLTGNDLICTIHTGFKSLGVSRVESGTYCSTRKTNTTIPISNEPILYRINGTGGFDSELLQTQISSPVYNISAKLIPVQSSRRGDTEIDVYSIEIDAFW
jgi:hypothetical protein